LSHRSWVLQIDGPRRRENLDNMLRRESSNALPSISQLPILSSSYDTTTLERNLDLPPIMEYPVNNNSQGNNSQTNYQDNNYANNNSTNTNNNTNNNNNNNNTNNSNSK
jgi:hypothetical protein